MKKRNPTPDGLKRRRKRLGLTQEMVAGAFSPPIKQATLSRYEDGNLPDRYAGAVLAMWADALDQLEEVAR